MGVCKHCKVKLKAESLLPLYAYMYMLWENNTEVRARLKNWAGASGTSNA